MLNLQGYFFERRCKQATRRIQSNRGLVSKTVLSIGLMTLLSACGAEQSQQQNQMPPANVETSTISAKAVEVTEEYAGRARGAREVEVRARVQGILVARNYAEGAEVAQGDVLFTLDQRPYQVALRSAEAERENARATLRQSQREWDRIRDLYEEGAVSTRERDDALSALELAQASLAMADANVERAAIDLDYSEVQAPVAGVTSLEAQPEGSLISSGDLLTTVTELDTIHVRFSLPARDAMIQRALRGENGSSRDAMLTLQDGTDYPHTGYVDFTQSTISPDTGTVRARAVFDNPDRDIVPGQFVRVRVVLQQLEDAIVVPEQAVVEGPRGPQVFVVDSDQQAEVRLVELGPLVSSGQVIVDGVSAGDEVIYSGLVNLQNGATVEVVKRDGEEL